MTQTAADQRLERTSGRAIFGEDAAGYHAGRIGYPESLYDSIFARVGAAPRVLEIGAGTGLATEAILARGPASLTVVEPAAELITFIEDRLKDPRLEFVTGAFPDVELDGPFDLAVCAAAFHWLDPDAALARIKTLLRPGGVWAMWWNSYRNYGIGDPLSDAIAPLLEGIPLPPSEGADAHYSLDTALHLKTLADAGLHAIEYEVYRRERQLRTDEVIALYLSYSFVRLLPAPRQSALLGRIRDLVDKTFGGVAPNIVLTASYSATKTS